LSLRVCIIFFLTLLSLNSWALEDLGARTDLFKIDRIDIKGLKKVEKEAVLERIGSKVDMVLDNYLLKKDLEKIYSMKYFIKVEAHQEVEEVGKEKKNVLVFQLKEKPIITKITYKGNDGLNEDDLKTQVKTKVYSILDSNTIKSDTQALLKHYEEKGYFLASIEYEEKVINEENVELIFNIKEYDKVKVKKISFLGTALLKTKRLKVFCKHKKIRCFLLCLAREILKKLISNKISNA